jgi:curved DNA-binding protein CbpA
MTQPKTDPYAILGIPRDATEPQVRQAYRRLAMRYHPDRHPDGRSSERMRRLNEAWHILSSPIRRRRYDADSTHGPTTSAAAGRSWTPVWTTSTQPGSSSTRSGARAMPANHHMEGAGWPGALVTVVVAWLVLGTIFFGFLPAPIIGLAVLAATRMIMREP